MNIHKHFVPNKLTMTFFGLIVLCFFAYGFYSYKNTKKIPKKEEQKPVDISFVDDKKSQNPLLIDSDNDGAYDWVENLYPELDPSNPDSDNDGVLDGRYLERVNQINEKKEKLNDLNEDDLTESEKLGRGVYTALLAIQQEGGVLDDETKEKISENVADYINNLSLGSKEYIRDELNLVPDTKENSFAYRDAMLAFYKKYPVNTSDITLIIKATQNPTNFKAELETAAMKYDTYIHELINMKVPYLVAGRHNELINTAGQIEGALKNLTLDNEMDDIVAVSFLSQIEKTMNKLIDVNLHIQKYFEIISEKGIFDR